MKDLLEIIEDLGVSIIDIANYPDNNEHLEYAQDRLNELKDLVIKYQKEAKHLDCECKEWKGLDINGNCYECSKPKVYVK